MRHLSPQTFLLLVAALVLLLGGGLWWASRLIGSATLRTGQPIRGVQKQAAPLHRAEPVAVAAEHIASMPLTARVVDAPAAPDDQLAGAKILRRNRGFSSANQPALSSGSHASLHVEARRPKATA